MNKYRQRLTSLQSTRTYIEEQLKEERTARKDCVRLLKRTEKAKEVIREVGLRTQEQLQYHISDITSLALQAVFPDPYTLGVEFVQRRNKTECDIYFSRGESKVDPLTASGGGAVDVAAFALRIASWSLMRPHSRNVIILDEPMRFVSEDLQEQASEMIKEVSKKLGIQFLLVTHEPVIAVHAEKVWQVKRSKKTGKSSVI
jgi:DNA repair exonuclease SbcCD ATPase subunit